MASMTLTERRIFESLFRYAYTGNLDSIKGLVEGMGKQKDYLDFALRVTNEDGMSVLHCAAAGGSKPVCQYLLETGKFDINRKDRKSGETPLHHAIFKGRFPAVANFLLENGADPNVGTKKRRTALHYAVDNGSRALVQSLISKGANVNSVADCGTPLQFAAERGKGELVKLLLEHHADPNAISHDLFSPLLASIHVQSLECMELLLQAGADPNFSASKGIPPLEYATTKGSKEIIRRLLNAGANPNDVDVLGMTPVEFAASKDKRGVVRILFHETSPIPTIPEWSISGLIKQVQSEKFREELEQKSTEQFLSSKTKGDECFNQKDYFEAIQWYSEALFYIPNDDPGVLYYRSQCWAGMNEWGLALEDAEACIALIPNWPDIYLLAGHLRMQLEEYATAASTFSIGQSFDPEKTELGQALRQANEYREMQKLYEV